MDLLVTHELVGLDFVAFAQADAANFSHDALGIALNLDRDSKTLRGGWLPRHTIREG